MSIEPGGWEIESLYNLITDCISLHSDTTILYLPSLKSKGIGSAVVRSCILHSWLTRGVFISPINSLTYIDAHDLTNRDRLKPTSTIRGSMLVALHGIRTHGENTK